MASLLLMLTAEIITVVGYLRKDYRTIVGAVLSIVSGKGAITSKIKHAIKLKTSPARLAQLLQPALAFCFSLQPMTAYHMAK